MTRTINEARSAEATRRFFSYRADEPSTEAPDGTAMSRAEWQSLSPGYRREIMRAFDGQEQAEQVSFRERKAAVEYAGRKRL